MNTPGLPPALPAPRVDASALCAQEAPPMPSRQQLLVLWLTHSDPGCEVTAWSRYDAAGPDTGMSGDQDAPPYANALAAMRDGWRIIQYPQARTPARGEEFRLGFLKHEFVLERLVERERTGEAS